MSIEEAIMELAAAIREQTAQHKEGMAGAVSQFAAVVSGGNLIETKAAELAQVTTERVEATKQAAIEDAQAAFGNDTVSAIDQGDPEIEEAVEKIEAAAFTLDYKKDVLPVLLAVAKAKGRPALEGLLKQFGVAKGDQLKADDLVGIVGAAKTLLAA